MFLRMKFTGSHGLPHSLVNSLLLSLCLALCSLPVFAETPDFDSLSARILEQSSAVDKLELELGRYHMSLVEPLHTLARVQIQANRFQDARDNADRALQIVRVSDGLESPLQFDYLQLVIEIEMARDNWDDIEEKIEHYGWLLGNKYQGDAETRLQRMLWLADVHTQGSLRDKKERRAYHIMQATGVNEIGVQFAQSQGLTRDPLYLETLFSLSRAYLRESEGIRRRGSVSYRLRELFPGTHILDERDVAIAKRYHVGLEKLEMLRDAVRASPAFDAEAVLLSEFYIAAWNELYEAEDDLAVSLQRIENFNQHASINTERFSGLFQLRDALPQDRLVLDADFFSDALMAVGD